MGVSTDGILCFGMFLKESIELPWGDDGIQDWWRYTICKYVSKKELFNEEGGYLKGVKPSQQEIDVYYEEMEDFDAKHPLPIEEIKHCSWEYPMYILAVPGMHQRASRGFPRGINTDELTVTPDQKQKLLNFCSSYLSLKFKEEDMQWWLASYIS